MSQCQKHWLCTQIGDFLESWIMSADSAAIGMELL